LSGLVFPGLGQIVLKHYKRGIALLIVVTGCLLAIVVQAVQTAMVILRDIESKRGVIDMDNISNAATRATAASNSLVFNSLILIIVLCWIIGTVDAYRIGKKEDLKEETASFIR